MQPTDRRQYAYVQTITNKRFLIEKIINSHWWLRAAQCVDNHYTNVDGVMLTDHLITVTENIDKVFSCARGSFLTKFFAFLDEMNIDQEKLREELRIVSLLHDIGKIEHDKSAFILHPFQNQYTIKRHAIVSLYAAIEILDKEDGLDAEEKKRIYAVIEEHDVSYGLFREWICTGKAPNYERWKLINDKIDGKPGIGLIYLLCFKLADTHGHCNINDVVWFFRQARVTYFRRLGIDLPIPKESDIR